MSHFATSWAFELDLPPIEKIVLLVLANCENDETLRCDPTQKYIARKASVSDRTVREMLRSLETRGLIARTKRGVNGGVGGRLSDNYRLACRGLPADPAGRVTGKSEGGYRNAASGIGTNRKEPEENAGPVPELSHQGPVDNFGTGPHPSPVTLSATAHHPLNPADVFASVGRMLPATFDDHQLHQLAAEILAGASSRVIDRTGYVIQAIRNSPRDTERHRGRWLLRADEIALEHAELARTGRPLF